MDTIEPCVESLLKRCPYFRGGFVQIHNIAGMTGSVLIRVVSIFQRFLIEIEVTLYYTCRFFSINFQLWEEYIKGGTLANILCPLIL